MSPCDPTAARSGTAAECHNVAQFVLGCGDDACAAVTRSPTVTQPHLHYASQESDIHKIY